MTIPTPEELRLRAAEAAQIATDRAADSVRYQLKRRLTPEGCSLKVSAEYTTAQAAALFDIIRPDFEKAGWTLTLSAGGGSTFITAKPTQ